MDEWERNKLVTVNQLRRMVGLPELSSLFERDPRAVAKLDHRERCEIAAFIICGVPMGIIAAQFEVSLQTVHRVRAAFADHNYKTYPEVVKEKMKYNSDAEFCADFITERMENKIKAAFPEFERPRD